MLITCQHASRLLSQSQDASLPWPQRMRLRVHLAMCVACRRVERQFAAMRLALQRLRELD